MAASAETDGTGDFVWRDTCPACGAHDHEPLLSLAYGDAPLRPFLERHYEGLARLDRLDGRRFDLWRCTGCGLLYQPLAPAGALLQEIYDRWIPLRDPQRLEHLPTLDDTRARIAELDFMLRTLGRPPSRVRYLDFGSGWGDGLLVARALGCPVAGCELSTERRRHAEALALPMLTLDEARGQRFDIVDLEQVLEHLVDPYGMLQALAELVGPDGLVRIAVPDADGVARGLQRRRPHTLDPALLMPVHPLEHLNGFTHASLVALARRCGLAPIVPSVRRLYDAYAGWASPRGAVANLLRPLRRHVWPRKPTAYFTRVR